MNTEEVDGVIYYLYPSKEHEYAQKCITAVRELKENLSQEVREI